MVVTMNDDDESSPEPVEFGLEAFSHARYPAPGRPQQPMHRTPSPWPWIIAGGAIAMLAVLGPIVLYIVVSGHPR